MPKQKSETGYEAMSETELRQFRLEKYAEERTAREARRAAGEVLEERRARQDEKWRKAAEAARDLFKIGANDEHDAKTRELFEMSDDEMEEAIEQQQALGGLSREERRAAIRAGSSKIVVPSPDAGGDVPIAD